MREATEAQARAEEEKNYRLRAETDAIARAEEELRRAKAKADV